MVAETAVHARGCTHGKGIPVFHGFIKKGMPAVAQSAFCTLTKVTLGTMYRRGHEKRSFVENVLVHGISFSALV